MQKNDTTNTNINNNDDDDDNDDNYWFVIFLAVNLNFQLRKFTKQKTKIKNKTRFVFRKIASASFF